MSDVHQQLLFGKCHNSLPPLRTRVVRIFTSSTFTDTSVERNALMRDIYPKLKDYCKSKYGLEFQVVDMRWGVRDEATDDHLTSELCMNEIAACQKLSTGPNFVTFLCQKYGYRPFPPKIPAAEFEVMRKVSMENGQSVELMDEWFQKDENAVPPIYVLHPISSKLTHFNDNKNPEKMDEDRKKWWQIFESLQDQLRNAAIVCETKGKFTAKQAEKFKISVTHDEVKHGILEASDNKEDHCVCFVRKFSDLEQHVDNKEAKNFIDIKWDNNEVDDEAKQLLTDLRDRSVPSCLKSPNLVVSTLNHWSEKGIDLDIQEHKQYLDNFLKTFHETMVKLIDRAVEGDVNNVSNDPMFEEILQHLTFCKFKCQSFHGRVNLLSGIKEHLQERAQGKPGTASPMVISGESGSGKTSVMAKAAFLTASEWFGSNSPAVIVRFLGTTPSSTGVRQLLKSLCQQVLTIYGDSISEIPDDYFRVVRRFSEVLRYATRDKPLVIFLDSLDQLSAAEGAHRMAWLPRNLPPHVAIVVSTLPSEFGILSRLQSILPETTKFLEVKALSTDESMKIVESWLQSEKRAVTNSQKSIISDVIQKCSLPLFLKLLFDQASRWQSYLPPNRIQVESSVKGMISLIFDRLESYHGKTLVQRALGYLTISQNGIAEAELEDLLSLDDEVLQDVYAYWLPPTRRIPPLLWTRIRTEINDYLVEREAEGSRVIYWYHRQFIETAKERYLQDPKVVTKLHKMVSEYFIGCWSGGKKKPFKYSQEQMKKFNKPETDAEDRNVAPQPLQFADGRFNIRKLEQLPYHLIFMEDMDQLKEHALCNFEFLMAKLKGLGLGEVLQDFTSAIEHNSSDNEIRLVSDAIRVGASALREESENLVFELIGRLKDADGKYIAKLVSDAERSAGSQVPLLPYNQCFPEAGGLLVTQLIGHTDEVQCVAATTDGRLLVSGSKDKTAIIWELESSTILHTLKGHHDGPVFHLVISPDNLLVITYSYRATGYQDQKLRNGQINVWNVETGEHFLKLDGHAGFGHCEMRITNDSKYAVSEMYTEGRDRTRIIRQFFYVVWSLENGQQLYPPVQAHKDAINDLVLANSPEGRHIIVTSGEKSDPSIKTWDLLTGAMLTEVLDYSKLHRRESEKLAVTADGRYISFHWEKHGILDVHTGEFQYFNERERNGPYMMKFIDNDEKLLVLDNFGLICYDVSTMSAIRTMSFNGGHGGKEELAFIVKNSNMEMVIALNEGNEYGAVWTPPKEGDRSDYCDFVERLPHIKDLTDLCVVSQQSSQLAITASKDKSIKVWNINSIKKRDGAEKDDYNKDKNEPFYLKHEAIYRVLQRVKTVDEEQRIAVADNLGKHLSLYDVDVGKLVSKKKWEGKYNHALSSLDTTPDGRRLFGIGSFNLTEFDTETLQVKSNKELDMSCSGIRISNNGTSSLLITGRSYADDIYGYDIEKQWYRGHHDPNTRANNIHFLRNGNVLLVMTSSLVIFTLQNLDVIFTKKFEFHRSGDNMICSAVTKDERILYTGFQDGNVKLYDISSGNELTQFQAHRLADDNRYGSDDYIISDLNLSSRDQFFVTSSSDRTVKLWDVASLRQVFVFGGHVDVVTMAKITADDQLVLSTAKEQFTVHVWSTAVGVQLININSYSPIESITIIPKKNRVFIMTSDDRAMFFKVNKLDESKLRARLEEKKPKKPQPKRSSPTKSKTGRADKQLDESQPTGQSGTVKSKSCVVL
ncbi:NACHT domain- and WD repeat-containing protein 1-like [Ptychodera flava]|uniref:NACHT domain- and WD repeat-containing protein 1-like n=1 Tax=Ptychodera flava TaxID=63121 RepID=UPI003969DF9F